MRAMRICYLVLLHHKFDQALRLIRRLAGPQSGFVLHIDAAADAQSALAFRKDVKSIIEVTYARAVRSRWGSYAQALAIMRCIQAAVRKLPAFDRYVLLSGQDYPIARQCEIEEFFSSHPDTEYLEAFPQDVMDAEAPGWSPYFRFRRYHVWVGRRHGVLPLLRKGPPPLPIYHGSTWWALTRDAVTYIADQFASNGSLRRYLRTGFLVDEAYVPTLIMASKLAPKVAGNNVTFAQWTPTSGPHPKTLGIGDLQELLASDKLFARKLDASVDASLMNRLDRI